MVREMRIKWRVLRRGVVRIGGDIYVYRVLLSYVTGSCSRRDIFLLLSSHREEIVWCLCMWRRINNVIIINFRRRL